MIYYLDLIRVSLPFDWTLTFTKFATYFFSIIDIVEMYEMLILGGQFQSPRNTPSRTDRLIMRGSAMLISWLESPGFA